MTIQYAVLTPTTGTLSFRRHNSHPNDPQIQQIQQIQRFCADPRDAGADTRFSPLRVLRLSASPRSLPCAFAHPKRTASARMHPLLRGVCQGRARAREKFGGHLTRIRIYLYPIATLYLSSSDFGFRI